MGLGLRPTDRVDKSESIERLTNTLLVWVCMWDLLTMHNNAQCYRKILSTLGS